MHIRLLLLLLLYAVGRHVQTRTVRVQIYTHTYRHMHIHTRVHSYMHANMYVRTCPHTKCMHAYIHTRIQYIHPYHPSIHTYTHTHVRMGPFVGLFSGSVMSDLASLPRDLPSSLVKWSPKQAEVHYTMPAFADFHKFRQCQLRRLSDRLVKRNALRRPLSQR